VELARAGARGGYPVGTHAAASAATFFNYVGRSLDYVLAQPERPEESDNRLRFGFGTEASAQDRAEFSRRYGCPLLESYGSSEGTCYIINTPGTPDGALGVPQQGFTVEIVSVLGEVCPPARFDASGVMLNREEAIGEIVSRGAAARFEGYYKNPGASQDRLRDGDFWTGDLGSDRRSRELVPNTRSCTSASRSTPASSVTGSSRTPGGRSTCVGTEEASVTISDSSPSAAKPAATRRPPRSGGRS
jgi:hypothetical protein